MRTVGVLRWWAVRVLVVHNRYSSREPSGENLAVDEEVQWLREAGVGVVEHTASNDDILANPLQRARVAAETVWSISQSRRIAQVIDTARPDVVHLHNLFPHFSGSVARQAVRRGVPVVWSVHNRRLVCVRGTNRRAGGPCELCHKGWRLPGIRHACLSDSVAGSALMTGASSVFAALARRSLTPVAISEAMRSWLVDTAGFAAERVRLKYDGVRRPETPPARDPAACRAFVFAGRVADEKGFPLLLDAWRRADLPEGTTLQIVGDGHLHEMAEAAVATDPRITWLGQVSVEETHRCMSEARCVVAPSTCEEAFGRVAAEAIARGRPVITTGFGGLREVVDPESGWITGDDPAALAHALEAAAKSDTAVHARGVAAQRRYEEHFSPEVTTRALLDLYRAVQRSPAADL